MSSNGPRFSVVMATYNGELYLQEQLDSLVRQTYLPIELVVCDDASTDSTASILKQFATAAPFPVRIVYNDQNRGYGESFLRAATAAEGDWIAFCDQDDVWLDYKLDRCHAVIGRFPEVDLLSHSAEQVDERLRSLPCRFPDHKKFEIRKPLRNKPFASVFGMSCCVRKSLLECAPLEDLPVNSEEPKYRNAHDLLVCHLANVFGCTAYLPDSLVLYRRHGAAVTGSSGSGFYKRSVSSRLKTGMFSDQNGFQRMAFYASQYSAFYRNASNFLKNRDADQILVLRAGQAAAYYAFLQEVYGVRSKIYMRETSVTARLVAFRRLVRFGAYSGAAGGIGLGALPFFKDLARVCVPWS